MQMKKITLLVLLTLLGGRLLAQENYFTEAKRLSLLTERLKTVSVTYNKSINRPELSDGGKFLQEIVAAINKKRGARGKGDAFNDSTKKPNQRNERPPVPEEEGAVQPPGGRGPFANVLEERIAVSVAEELSPEDIKVLKKEVTYAAWLIQTDDGELLRTVRDFPEHFVFLEEIEDSLEKAVAQSGGGNSSFAFSESAIIYGVTDFIIRRAKEELVEAYLAGWYDRLNGNDIIRPLITQTLSVTKAFTADNSLSLARYGDKWKAAIQEDLRHIPQQLGDETYVDKVLRLLNIQDSTRIELVAAVSGTASLTHRLYLKEHVVNAVGALSDGYCAAPDKKNPMFKKLVVLSDVLMRIAGTMDDKNVFRTVNLQDLETLDLDDWKILLKLLYARNNRRLDYVTNKAVLLPSNILVKADEFRYVIGKVITQAQTFQQLINNATKEKLTFSDTRKLFDAGFGLFNQAQDVMRFFNIASDSVFRVDVKPYFQFAQEMGEGIAAQEYGKVLDGALGVMKELNNSKAKPADKNIDTIISNLQVYGSFMLNILAANKPEEVEAALDELIPKGQYQLKNTKTFAVSLSAFPGVMVGGETVKTYDQDKVSGAIQPGGKNKAVTSFSVAPYLPIGFDFSFGYGNKDKVRNGVVKKRYSSFSLGVQLIDLGAVLNYRISGSNDSTVASDPEISWQQLLSPGAQAMLHLPNSPIVLGVGCNYTPSLRKVEQQGLTYNANAFRFGVFVGVDVTIFNFYSSRRNAVRGK